MNEQQQPATEADLALVREDLTESETRLTEHIRHIETSLLTAFHNYA